MGALTSGGALVDSSGRMIGLNLYLPGRGGGARAPGVNFAIAADTVAAVVPQLIAYGKVVQPVREAASRLPTASVVGGRQRR